MNLGSYHAISAEHDLTLAVTKAGYFAIVARGMEHPCGVAGFRSAQATLSACNKIENMA